MTTTDNTDDIQAKQVLLQELLNQGRRQTERVAHSAPREVNPAQSPIAMSVPVAPPSSPSYGRQPVVRSVPMPSVATRMSPVSTQPVRTRPLYETGVIEHETIDLVAVTGIRVIAYLILAASFVGSVLAFNGKWEPSWYFWHGISPVAALAGIGLQLEITVVEWWRGANWKDPVYLFHLAVDVVLTFFGFWQYIGDWLSRSLDALATTVLAISLPLFVLSIAARIVFFVVCIFAARKPEQWLVKRPVVTQPVEVFSYAS